MDTIKIFYFLFISNYIFILLFLIKNFQLFKFYIVNLSIATLLCSFYFIFDIKNNIFFILNLSIFILIVILPISLSKIISYLFKNINKNKIKFLKTLLYIRYILAPTLNFYIEYIIGKYYEINFFKLNNINYEKIEDFYKDILDSLKKGKLEKAIYLYSKLRYKVSKLKEEERKKYYKNIIELEVYIHSFFNINVTLFNDIILNNPNYYDIKIDLNLDFFSLILDILSKDNIEKEEKEKIKEYLKLSNFNEDQKSYIEDIITNFDKIKNSQKKYFKLYKKYFIYLCSIDVENFNDIDKEIKETTQSYEDKLNEKSLISMILIILNIIIFIIIYFKSLKTSWDLELLNWGVNSYDFIYYEKQYWRYITSLFLHYNYVHLLLNCFGLYIFGKIIESLYGRLYFLIIYFISGISASYLSIHINSYTFSLGASGSICGLIGAATYYFIFKGKEFPEEIRKNYKSSFLFIIVGTSIMGVIIPQIDNIAHLTGLIIGFSIGFILDFLQKENKFVKIFYRILAFFIIVCVLGSFYFQIKNVVLYSYPTSNIKFFWYSVKDENNNENLILPLPFTWKSDKIIKNKDSKNSYKDSIIPTLTLNLEDMPYWDVYNITLNGNLLNNFYLLKKEELINIDNFIIGFREIIRIKENYEDIKISEVKEDKIGKNRFKWFSFKFKLNIPPNKSFSLISFCFFLKRNTTLYFFKFQFQRKYEKQYKKIMYYILKNIHFLSTI